MTASVQVALEALAARIEATARASTPLRTAQAVALLRAAGVPRNEARRLLATAGDGRWIVGRGQTTARGGCPPQILIPVSGPAGGVLAAATTNPDRRHEPVDLRTRVLPGVRTAGFPKVEIRVQVVVLAGERWWQRFAALAEVADIVCALRALGVEPDAGCENSHPATRGWRRERCV